MSKPKSNEILFKSHSRLSKTCHTCQKKQTPDMKPFQVCARCREVVYCSKECQKENWPLHKGPCGSQITKKYKEALAGHPEQAAEVVQFHRWFETPEKLFVLRQAIMHALNVTQKPKAVDERLFILEFVRKPPLASGAKHAPVDRFRLVEGRMYPRKDMVPAPIEEGIRTQNEVVKGRGKLGVVPVMMKLKDYNEVGGSWLPLALNCSQEEAIVCLKECGWRGSYWLTRLKQTLHIPQAELEFIQDPNDKPGLGWLALPKAMQKKRPIFGPDTMAESMERLTNLDEEDRAAMDRGDGLPQRDESDDDDDRPRERSNDGCIIA